LKTLKISHGDIVLDGLFRPDTVSYIEKLGQLIYEILLIQIQPNGLGSGLCNLDVDTKALITSALSRYKTLQDKSIFVRTKEEIYASLGTFNITQKGTDIYFSLYLYNTIGAEFIITGKTSHQ